MQKKRYSDLSLYKKVTLLIIIAGIIALLYNIFILVFVYKFAFIKVITNISVSVLFLTILVIIISYFYENTFFKIVHTAVFMLTAILALFGKSKVNNPLKTEFIYSMILFILTYLIVLKYNLLKEKFVIKTTIYILIVLSSYFFKSYQIIGNFKESFFISLVPIIFIVFSLLIVYLLYQDEIEKTLNKKRKYETLVNENLHLINIGKNYSQLIHNIKNDLNLISAFNQIIRISCLENIYDESAKSKLKEYLQKQNDVVNRIVDKIHINRTLTHYKKEVILKKIDPVIILENIINIFNQLEDIIRDIRFKTEFLSNNVYIKIVPAIFIQIIENIIINGIEAFYEDCNSNKIKLSNKSKNIDFKFSQIQFKKDKFIKIKTDNNEREYIIEISNNGPQIKFCKGCNLNKKSCLKCPYFNKEYTTKEYGTGQGMSFVIKMLKEFKGNLIVKTSKDITVFKLVFLINW